MIVMALAVVLLAMALGVLTVIIVKLVYVRIAAVVAGAQQDVNAGTVVAKAFVFYVKVLVL